MSKETFDTLGHQKRLIMPLKAKSKEDFIREAMMVFCLLHNILLKMQPGEFAGRVR